MSAIVLRSLVLVGVLLGASVRGVSAQPDEPPVAEVAPPPSAASAPTCDHAAFASEIVQPAPVRERRCAPPSDPALEAVQRDIDAAVANPKLESAERTAELQQALRALAARFGSSAGWGATFAHGIGLALDHPARQRAETPRFSEARSPVPGVDIDGCLFVVGEAELDDYACFILAGDPVPDAGSEGGGIVALPWQQAALVHRTYTIAHSALQKLDLPALEKARHRLLEAEKRWDAWIEDGYLQYPWELALQGAFTHHRNVTDCAKEPSYCSGTKDLDPDRMRVIFLHPGIGAGFRGFGANGDPSADAALTLSLEAFGFTSYARDFDWYWGLSLGAGVDDGDFGDVRFGAFVHLTRWTHLGYLVSVMRESTRKDATLFVSMDLGSAFGANFLH